MDTLASRVDSGSLDLNAVKVFAAVLEHGGFRQAALALALPKSTVSLRVAQLETQLGQRLLHRTTRSVKPTDVGQAFYERTAPALSAVGEAARSIVDARQTPRGVLRVSAASTFAELFMGDIFVEYLQRYPEVRLSVDLSDRYVDLVGEGVDVAVRAGALPDSSLVARPLGTGSLACVASPSYLKARGTPSTPSDLTQHECLTGPSERHAQWAFFRRGVKEVVTLRPRVRVNSFVLCRELALRGVGIARMPEGLVSHDLKKGRLVRVLQRFEPPAVPVSIVYASSKHLAPRVRAFVDLVVSRFANGSLEAAASARLSNRFTSQP